MDEEGETTMKHVCITYHMSLPGMDAETCITLPMTEENAKDLIANGEDSVVYRGVSASDKM